VIKSRRMICGGHVACMREKKSIYRVVLAENLKERDHLEDTAVDGKIILRQIFRK